MGIRSAPKLTWGKGLGSMLGYLMDYKFPLAYFFTVLKALSPLHFLTLMVIQLLNSGGTREPRLSWTWDVRSRQAVCDLDLVQPIIYLQLVVLKFMGATRQVTGIVAPVARGFCCSHKLAQLHMHQIYFHSRFLPPLHTNTTRCTSPMLWRNQI